MRLGQAGSAVAERVATIRRGRVSPALNAGDERAQGQRRFDLLCIPTQGPTTGGRRNETTTTLDGVASSGCEFDEKVGATARHTKRRRTPIRREGKEGERERASERCAPTKRVSTKIDF